MPLRLTPARLGKRKRRIELHGPYVKVGNSWIALTPNIP
jgi:hypothetical protein